VAVNYNASGPGAKEVVAELEKLGRRAEAVHADVARADQVRVMMDRVLGRFGRLDILVNNAGVMTRGPSSTFRWPTTSRCSPSTSPGRSSAPSRRCVRWWR
jgi:NAD(P)-dependent dehydrogenase (short-subunit alcohol dehydrogenase family)